MLSIFMLFTCFGQLVQQIMPHFVTQRALYEVRERPSKTYSWQAFMLTNIIVELPWQTLMSVIMFFSFYYPVGFYRNAEPAGQVHERGALFFLLTWIFLIFTSTFTHMIIAAVETAEAGGNIANLLFSLTLVFCGVLATPQQFPGFWIFMYRVSPFTYLIDSFLAVGVANTKVVCASNEYLHFDAPNGQSCSQYMSTYINNFGGYLEDTNATGTCSFCTVKDTNTFLASINSSYSNRWRNFGIMWVYVIFNIAAALLLYWLVRVPKGTREEKEPKDKEAKKASKKVFGIFSKEKA
jgi:ATP-binding cassette subfamily G (WHITE) protein 2 (PDR)